MSRALSNQISFADWELMRQGVVLEPVLQAISDFLDDHEELVGKIRGDLRRGLKKPDTGRSGLAPQEVLRALVLMRVKNWDYRELRERIADGYTLRLFTRFGCRPVPKHNAFHRAFVRLTPATLQAVNELVVQAAVDLGMEDGTKLRVDTTVVQADVHYPTDSTLLWDSVRVLSRLLKRLGKLLEQRLEGFRNRTRAARRRMQALQRMSATQRLGQQIVKYRELIAIAEEVVACARSAVAKLRTMRGKASLQALEIAGLLDEIGHYCGLADRVIDQARRRVLDGEQVPNAEKIYSIFEPHTDLIKRGKVRTPVEFGHKVLLAESARGLITQYQVLTGNPQDEQHVGRSLERHKKAFGRVPELYSADRGFFSERNLALCQHGGVEVVCIPQSGGKRTPAREACEKAQPSSGDSASEPASRDASPCCSADAA
jgi:IS5 family transposase